MKGREGRVKVRGIRSNSFASPCEKAILAALSAALSLELKTPHGSRNEVKKRTSKGLAKTDLLRKLSPGPLPPATTKSPFLHSSLTFGDLREELGDTHTKKGEGDAQGRGLRGGRGC